MTDGMADQVPDEPTGTTLDGTPWVEPRPPHLPDTVTGLPVPTILFTLGAIVVGYLTIRDRLPEPGAGPGGPVLWVLSLSIPVSSFLIPAVFFLRHRDAWSAHRAMALGTAFLAIGRSLQLLGGYLGDWFDTIVPPSQLGINPLSLALQVVVSLYAILAVALMARGLIQARLYADRPGMRAWWALLAIVAIVSSLLAFTVFGGLSTDVADENFTELYWLTMLGVVLNVLTVGAWAYLTGQAIAGRRADEDPASAGSSSARRPAIACPVRYAHAPTVRTFSTTPSIVSQYSSVKFSSATSVESPPNTVKASSDETMATMASSAHQARIPGRSA